MDVLHFLPSIRRWDVLVQCKCFNIFPGDEYQRLVEPQHIRPGQLETHQVVDDELVEWLQQERLPAEGRPVQPLALLVAEGRLDYPEAELRVLGVQVVGGVLQVPEEPSHCLLKLRAGDFPSVPYGFGVLQDGRPVFSPGQLF